MLKFLLALLSKIYINAVFYISLFSRLDGLVEIPFLLEENVLVNEDCSGMTMTFLVTDLTLFQV